MFSDMPNKGMQKFSKLIVLIVSTIHAQINTEKIKRQN